MLIACVKLKQTIIKSALSMRNLCQIRAHYDYNIQIKEREGRLLSSLSISIQESKNLIQHFLRQPYPQLTKLLYEIQIRLVRIQETYKWNSDVSYRYKSYQHFHSQKSLYINLLDGIHSNYTPQLPSDWKEMKIIFAVHDPRIYQQARGTCYAHAIAEAIVSTQLRIIGRRLESHTLIVKRIVRKHGYNGASSLQKLLRQQCLNKSLRFSLVTQYQAEQAVLKGRVILIQFSLSEAGWQKFDLTFKQNSKASISKLESGNSGHAAAIIGMVGGKNGGKKSWVVKNEWGKNFADNGTFRIKMYSLPLIFIDVYFTIGDLKRSEKGSYESFR